jgi:hypothetical protein
MSIVFAFAGQLDIAACRWDRGASFGSFTTSSNKNGWSALRAHEQRHVMVQCVSDVFRFEVTRMVEGV